MLKIVETKLPSKTFGQKVNLNLLAQVNYILENRSHIGLRNTKTRSEVNRTTKKVYKQKGTGGARHGSRRANVFVGGGIVFGPRAVKRVLTISKGLNSAAKVAAFSAKAKNKQIMVVAGVDKVAKTKEVAEFIKKLDGKNFAFLLSEKSMGAGRYFRNLANVKVFPYKDISVLEILRRGVILIDELALSVPETAEVKKAAPKKAPAAKTTKKEAKA